jgi:hypothetical protein
MTPIIVLFNLLPGVTADAYEAWARSTDLPIVRGLRSIAGFDVYKAQRLLRGDDAPPYQYVELLLVEDMDAFRQDAAQPTMQRVAAEFRTYADSPTFVVCENLA